MQKKVMLITGASGEIGQALVNELSATGTHSVLTLDLRPLNHHHPLVNHVEGSILDEPLLDRLFIEYEIDTVFHLAALLSTHSEIKPEAAHKVNVDGTLNLLRLAAEQSRNRGERVKFIFPSSIAVYGMPNLGAKATAGQVSEDDWNFPQTMYGCNKLYCEKLGVYFTHHYRQLSTETFAHLDFRSVRFPGLISAFTVPSGGTSDYGPEMIHAAAKGEAYDCFVREDSQISFMAMPDGVKALVQLARAPLASLSRQVYNVSSFSLTAAQIRDIVLDSFPQAEIAFVPHLKRQSIVDSWPADLDDTAARRDWGWQPDYLTEKAFGEYLIPNIQKRYQK